MSSWDFVSRDVRFFPDFSRFSQNLPPRHIAQKTFIFSPFFVQNGEPRKNQKNFKKGVDSGAVVCYNKGTKGKSATEYAKTADRQERPKRPRNDFPKI